MNWTGGTLQRTKHANNGVIQKQKAYFARARTQLQQTPDTPALFRPDYLQLGDDYEFGQCLTSFGPGPMRDLGHSARRRGEEGAHRSPTTQKPRRTFSHSDTAWNSPQFAQSGQNSRGDNERQHEQKRTGADADTEKQLLEANKKRLLRQKDWVGVDPLRPVDMQFPSIKVKSRIGKRRMLNATTKEPIYRRSPTTFLRRTGQDELAGHDGTFMSGALPVPTATDNIRVRIGSDALTTAASAQPNDDTLSLSNSDSMLFDEEEGDAAQLPEPDAMRIMHQNSHVHTANPRPGVPRHVRSDRSYSPEQGRNNLTQRPDSYAAVRIRHTVAQSNGLGHSFHENEAANPSYRLTHHVGGVERPLKLVFDKRRPSKTSPAVSATRQTSELQRVHADLNAEDIETGRVSRNAGELSEVAVGRHPNAPFIDDEEPWRPYLDADTSSSDHVRVDDGTGMSVPQPHVPARNTQAHCTSCPQHAAQGNLTHVNLLKVSASLPVVARRGGYVPDARPLPRPPVVKDVNNDEALWQSYVLGSDPQSVIETIHLHNESSEDSMSHATQGYASTRLLPSNAVTSVSSTQCPATPFRSLSGQASRISDDVQYAPLSGSRSATSVAPYGVWGRINSPSKEDVWDEDQGVETSARNRFGEQSTHAEFQNYASHDSAMSNDTRTSRGELDQQDRAWDDVSRRANASGSVVWQRGRDSSIRDIPDSD